MGGKIGVLVELNCESDFVARTDDFQTLLKEIALQVAAANPQYVRREDVPADVLDRERGDLPRADGELGQAAAGHRQDRRGQARQLLRAGRAGRSAVDPRPEDDASASCIQAAIAKLGENIGVARFVRFKVGESQQSAEAGLDIIRRAPVSHVRCPPPTPASS